MLSILADVLMIATGQRYEHNRPSHHSDVDWTDHFISSRMRGLENQNRRFNTRRDFDW